PVEPKLLPEKIIQYVKRTAEKVIISDTRNHESYGGNSTVETKSAVCIPIMKQGRLKGMLYLENKHFSGAFTPERILILELLSSKAAISIENASYYARLETTVEELRESEA